LQGASGERGRDEAQTTVAEGPGGADLVVDQQRQRAQRNSEGDLNL